MVVVNPEREQSLYVRFQGSTLILVLRGVSRFLLLLLIPRVVEYIGDIFASVHQLLRRAAAKVTPNHPVGQEKFRHSCFHPLAWLGLGVGTQSRAMWRPSFTRTPKRASERATSFQWMMAIPLI